MAPLDELRKQIDEVDRKILELLNQRASYSLKVRDAKGSDVPTYVPTREKEVVHRLAESSQGPFPREAVKSVFREIVSACRSLQKVTTVAFMGPPGSYHHAAGLQQFGQSAEYASVSTIGAVFNEVERGKADYGVVAIENSTEGGVAATMDRFGETSLRIISEIFQPITHHLVSRCDLQDIEKVYSHPQALAQCRNWLEQNLPQARLVETSSTTQGAIMADKEERTAAVAGDLAAEMIQIPILVHGIEDMHGNVTRFFVLSREAATQTGDDKSAMIVYVRDEVGALYRMLQPLMEHKVNLSNLVSRPTKKQAWQYMFFVELNGHHNDELVQRAMDDLEARALHVQWLGSFPRGNIAS